MAFDRAQMFTVGGIVGQQTLLGARWTVANMAKVLIGMVAFGWNTAW